MSGDAPPRATFIGDAMASVVQAIVEVEQTSGRPAVVVGGLAVLCRLSHAHRATVDLDVVDRGDQSEPLLELLRQAPGSTAVLPEAVMLPTAFGDVRVDVLTVRQVELDDPSTDPGDRLHASSHAWAHQTASRVSIVVHSIAGPPVAVTAAVAEPGPLIAMKLQAVMDRGEVKRGTDLQDVLRLVLDEVQRPLLLNQLTSIDAAMAADVAAHVRLWLVKHRADALRWMRQTGTDDITLDDVDLVAELLLNATRR
ncbi:MAG: nucleotidyl transferase AbiEii/AbiGii toxin family protein [Quadrisphaera sp.]